MSTNIPNNLERYTAGATTQTFLNIWFRLLALTGLEVFLAYEQIPVLIFLTALVQACPYIKAATIIAYFMHLKFEKLCQPLPDVISDVDPLYQS